MEDREKTLYANATDGNLQPAQRAAFAEALDGMGYRPDDLCSFVPIPDSVNPDFMISRYPVTNEQYARFLDAQDYALQEYWMNFPKFDRDGHWMEGHCGIAGWDWLQKNKNQQGKVFSRWWNDAEFGKLRASAPVVGVTWYETNAYCKWLLAHWEEMEESHQNKMKPKQIRLPTRQEWVIAAGGENPEWRFPWDKVGRMGSRIMGRRNTIIEVLQRANVRESGIGRTTPVWMYPQGASQPYGLMDLAGNVYEWNAEYGEVIWISGGSWDCKWHLVRVAWKNFGLLSIGGNQLLGFRVLGLPG